MNLNIFLAKAIGNKGDATGKLTTLSSTISIISVTISIAVIIVAVAIASGFREEIKREAVGFSGDFQILSPGSDIMDSSCSISDSLPFIQELKELYSVKDIYKVGYKYGMIKGEKELSGVLFKGVDSLYNRDFFLSHLVEGNIPLFSGNISNEIILSKELAQIMSYKVGDTVNCYFIDRGISVRKFKLSAIINVNLDKEAKLLAITDFRDIANLNNWEGKVSGYEIFLKDKYSSFKLNEEVENKMLKIIYGNDNYEDSIVLSPLQKRYYVLFDWLKLLDLNVLILLILMIAVASFNMISGLLIILFERIYQIGLFKALGMNDMGVAKIFLTKGAIISLKGILYGNIIAISLSLLQDKFYILKLNPENYFLPYIPIEIDLIWIACFNIIAFVAILIVMVIPCRFISKISPAKTMVVR